MAAGRFAPSPTGPLHLGSLLAATASFLEARTRGQLWQVRIDDLDTPRNVPGAQTAILATLEAHGLEWDGPVTRQSQHQALYAAALNELAQQDVLFYCNCSRRRLAAVSAYPGYCRAHSRPRADSAIRIRVDSATILFHDGVLGAQQQQLEVNGGDFIVRRRDGQYAYQLATAVDDGAAEITHIVRGSDLLDTCGRQIYLMQRLGLNVPEYAHVPTLVNASGQKLSKQHHAPAVIDNQASSNLAKTFALLGMQVAAQASRWAPAELLAWGVANWDLRRIPQTRTLHVG